MLAWGVMYTGTKAHGTARVTARRPANLGRRHENDSLKLARVNIPAA